MMIFSFAEDSGIEGFLPDQGTRKKTTSQDKKQLISPPLLITS
jgi:hypothetical protein